jgi:dihydrofolate reductase
MRKLILEEWISLDGYVSDKEGKLDFFAKYVRESYISEYRLEFLNTIDTIIFGSKTYSQFASLWPDRPIEKEALAEKINTAKKIVFSSTLSKAPWGKWKEAEVESGDLIDRVNKLKSMPGKDIIVWGSITIAQNLMNENLIDEYHIHLCPTLTAGGRKLFTEELQPPSLTLIDEKRYSSEIVYLHYKRNLPVK